MAANTFFKGLGRLLLLNLLIKPLWIFAIDRQVQNSVGHAAYGTYFSLFNLTYVLLFLADAGLTNMVAQRLAAAGSLHVRQLFRWKLLLLLVYAVGCGAAGAVAGITEWRILGYLILVQGLASLFVFLRSLLTARQFFQTDAVFSILDKTLLLALCAAPVYGLFTPITIDLFLRLQVVSISLAVGSLLFFLVKKKMLTTGSPVAPARLLRWTAPFVLLVVLMAAHNRLDAFLLERLHTNGAAQAGIYAMAYRLLDAGNMVGYLTASFLVPFLARHAGNRKMMQQVLLLCRHGLLLLSAAVVAFVLVFAPWLQALLYHTANAGNDTVLRLCLLSLPAYYLTHIYGSALTATANFRLFSILLSIAVTVNVGLNSWLIPSYGAVGCCIAALATQYGLALSLWYLASRKLAILLSGGAMFGYGLCAFLLALCFYYSQKVTGNVWIILSSIALLALVVVIVWQNNIRKIILLFYK